MQPSIVCVAADISHVWQMVPQPAAHAFEGSHTTCPSLQASHAKSCVASHEQKASLALSSHAHCPSMQSKGSLAARPACEQSTMHGGFVSGQPPSLSPPHPAHEAAAIPSANDTRRKERWMCMPAIKAMIAPSLKHLHFPSRGRRPGLSAAPRSCKA